MSRTALHYDPSPKNLWPKSGDFLGQSEPTIKMPFGWHMGKYFEKYK